MYHRSSDSGAGILSVIQSVSKVDDLHCWPCMHAITMDVLVVDDSDSHAAVTVRAIGQFAPQAAVVRLKNGEQALQFIFCRDSYRGRWPEMPRLILLELET